jgi:hypothetical protein
LIWFLEEAATLQFCFVGLIEFEMKLSRSCEKVNKKAARINFRTAFLSL